MGQLSGLQEEDSGSGRRRRCCRPRFNSLWSVWYGLLVAGLHGWIACRFLALYWLYSRLPWQSRPAELTAYLCLLAGSVCLLPPLLLAACLRVGNRANDGAALGCPERGADLQTDSLPPARPGALRNLWHHGLPTAPLLHVLSAALLCTAQLIIQARLITNGFLPPDEVWRTDLDVFLGGVPAGNASSSALPLDPGSGYLTSCLAGPRVSAQFASLAAGLLLLAIRYASVFWPCQRCLAALFSLQLLLNAVHLLVGFCGFSVLYKAQVYGGPAALRLQPAGSLLLEPRLSGLLFALSSALVLLSGLTVYLYGYHRFSWFLAGQQPRLPLLAAGPARASAARLWPYTAHSAALCLLLAVGVSDGPLLYDLSSLYRASLDRTVLTAVVTSVAHHSLWVLLWLALTLRSGWTFRVHVLLGRPAVCSPGQVRLLQQVRARGGGDSPLLVVSDTALYSVQETLAQNLILSVAARRTAATQPVPLPCRTRRSEEQGRQSEERYVQLPPPRQSRNNLDSSANRRSRYSDYQPLSTGDDVTEERVTSPGGEQQRRLLDDTGDYVYLHRSQQQLRRAGAETAADPCCRQPLLPPRYAIRPPPEAVYMTRGQVRPAAPLRRAASHELLPPARTDPWRNLSFRRPPSGGSTERSQPRVAFDLRTTLIGEPLSKPRPLQAAAEASKSRPLLPSPGSAFSPPVERSIAESALSHLPPPPPSLLSPAQPACLARMRNLRQLAVIEESLMCGRDSANFSMSNSSGSGSDAGSNS